MFDSIDGKLAISDMFDIGVKNDMLSLLHQSSQNIEFSVKTEGGLTEKQNISSSILQGDTWGTSFASVQTDIIGNSAQNSDHFYLYMEKIPVGILGQVDDLMGVTEAGYKAQTMNSFINYKSAENNFQFGVDKCKAIVIGKSIEKFHKNKLMIDSWSNSHTHISEDKTSKLKFCSIYKSKCCNKRIPNVAT